MNTPSAVALTAAAPDYISLTHRVSSTYLAPPPPPPPPLLYAAAAAPSRDSGISQHLHHQLHHRLHQQYQQQQQQQQPPARGRPPPAAAAAPAAAPAPTATSAAPTSTLTPPNPIPTMDDSASAAAAAAAASSSSYDGFAWRETRPGVWERDIDEAERFYSHLARAYEGSGRLFFAVTGHVSLAVDVAADSSPEDTSARIDAALRHAWLKMRFDCPTIASQVVWDWGQGRLRKVYETFAAGEASQRFWLDQTFRPLGDTGQTGAQFANADPPAPAMPTLFVLTPPHLTPHQVRRDLVLRAPHDVIDGIGALHLLNSLVANAVNPFKMQNFYAPPVFGSEVRRLSAPLRVAAGVAPALSPQQRARLADMAAQNTAAKTGVEMASLPYRRGALVPGRHQRAALELTEYQTEAVLQAARRVQATVTHAFHAAIALAVRDRQHRTPKQRKVRYLSYILANERPRCSFGASQHAAAIYRCSVPSGAPQQTQHAAAVYHSVAARSLYVDLTVPHVNRDTELAERNEEFRATLVHMRNFYRSVRDDRDLIHFAPTSWAERTPAWFPREDGRPPTIPPPNPAPNVSISSMGLIDGIIRPEQGPFRVYSPWVTGEELGTGLGVFVGTFRGRLELSAAYNDAWHDEAEVQAFLNDCWRAVREGLGLSV